MKRHRVVLGMFVGLVLFGVGASAFVTLRPVFAQKNGGSATDIKAMLQAFADDYQSDPLAGTPTEFGIRVKGASTEDWSVRVARVGEEGKDVEVVLSEGFPASPRTIS